ncbi:hypothetical protein [Rhizobium rhizogenes]|nr:hypothetical protein [Rhizobium rhizogenes]
MEFGLGFPSDHRLETINQIAWLEAAASACSELIEILKPKAP